MSPEDRFALLKDDSRWNVEELRPRKNPFGDTSNPRRSRNLSAIAGGVAVVAIVTAVLGSSYFFRGSPTPPAVSTETSSSGEPLSNATPAPSPTGSPVQEPLFIDHVGSATCDNLLSSATKAGLRDAGYVDVSEERRKGRASSPDHEPSSAVQYGGIECAWGPEGAQYSDIIYTYGPISSAQSITEQAKIVDAGGAKKHVTPYGNSYTFAQGGYAFGDGYWATAFTYNNGVDVFEDVVANAPSL